MARSSESNIKTRAHLAAVFPSIRHLLRKPPTKPPHQHQIIPQYSLRNELADEDPMCPVDQTRLDELEEPFVDIPLRGELGGFGFLYPFQRHFESLGEEGDFLFGSVGVTVEQGLDGLFPSAPECQ
jgi:hypothetical protein